MKGLLGAVLLSSADALVASHAAFSGAQIATRTSVGVTSLRAPYDPRSVTETFEMWTAAAPPKGFTWGYDSRSTTECYERWVASEAGDEAPPPPPSTEAAGVPSVTDTVYSWYDSGMRLSPAETEAREADPPTPVVHSWYDAGMRLSPAETEAGEADPPTPVAATAMEGTITLTDEQLKAYGEPAVRLLTDKATVLAPAQALTDTLTLSEDTLTLTEEQVKAYGGPAVRALTLRSLAKVSPPPSAIPDADVEAVVWPMLGGSAGYHRMAGRLTKPDLKVVVWPTVGGSAGYHRMAGRLIKPDLKVVVVPTASVESWFDAGVRL